ncbi:MAG: hypothetical protein JRF54_01610 [Deltaproteobacteria bacterium]|nr:hypothetical protein [Deltaproteobacteria bacterium]MBW2717847.1 hypothetical protein [Deltaproteobacteria bacterium]
MTLNYVRQTLTLIALLSLVLTGCQESGGRPPPEVIIDNFGDAGIIGCSQPIFPDAEPDMSPLFPPEFVTEDGEQQRQIRPGDDLLAEVTVNGATRQVRVELTDTWTPERVIQVVEVDTGGNETIPLLFVTDRNARSFFFMRVILCGDDCNEREVLFDLVEPDLDNQTETGINVDYERTLIENGEVVRVDQTCVRPFSILIQ